MKHFTEPKFMLILKEKSKLSLKKIILAKVK